eukprot:Nitzschia sp. Nitz4//scaffold74_size92883//12390//14262//NITZ4_004812-RA/size92883-processed-gene-0.25-mRNA-1//-1//CDS//3329557562//4402//frame0
MHSPRWQAFFLIVFLALPSAIVGFVLPTAILGRFSIDQPLTFPDSQYLSPFSETPTFSTLYPRITSELHARRRSNHNTKSNRGAYHNQARFHRKWGVEGPSIRQERVASLVQSELTNILHSEKVRGKPLEPELRRRITVVSVDMSPDLLHARVSVSIRKAIMPEEDEDVDVEEDNRRIDNDYRIRAMQEPVADFEVDFDAFGDDIKPKKKRTKGRLFDSVELSSGDEEEDNDNVVSDDFLDRVQDDEEHEGVFEEVLGQEREPDSDDEELEEDDDEESIYVSPEEAAKLGIHNSSDIPFTEQDFSEFWKEFGPAVDEMQQSKAKKKPKTAQVDEGQGENQGEETLEEEEGGEFDEEEEEVEDEEDKMLKDFDWSDEAIAGLLDEDDLDYSDTDTTFSEDSDDDEDGDEEDEEDDAYRRSPPSTTDASPEEDWDSYMEKYGIPEEERHLFSEDHIIQSQPSVNQRRTFVWLVRNARSIRYALGKKIHHMRRIPELTFVRVDLGEAVDMSMLIDRISEMEEKYELPQGEKDGIDYDLDEEDEGC